MISGPFVQYVGPNDLQILCLEERESGRLTCRLLYTSERFMKKFLGARPPFQAHVHFVSIKNASRTAGSTVLSLAYG